MNRVLDRVRGHLARAADAPDRQLLDRFLAGRDEAAFAELVRRHGRVVWGTCHRRLANPHDAEDAFQATFLVLLRRAARLAPDTPLGPWLHRVAALTARNVLRGNRRRAAVSGPLTHDVPAPAAADRVDLDAVLLALPERYRAPVVLCHLEGLSRREAAARLGCPEGTLSSLLSRALARLRARLGDAAPALLAAAGVAAVPAGLSAAAVRTGVIFTTSSLTAAGVSPAVAGLAEGVLRMFWVKKLTAAGAAVVIAGGVFAGLAAQTGGTAPPQPKVPLGGPPPGPNEDPPAGEKRLAKELADLKKLRQEVDAKVAELAARKAKFDEVRKATGGADLKLYVNGDVQAEWAHRFLIEERTAGGPIHYGTTLAPGLPTLLARAKADPKGPKTVAVEAEASCPAEHVRAALAALRDAGFTTVKYDGPLAGELLGIGKGPGSWQYDRVKRYTGPIDLADLKDPPAAPKKP
jgi:RNA polymerase sigma factor (sigma-70 family)